MYDLEVSGHPSFTVNGFLVHNCKEAAWHAVRSTLTATRGPVRIIGNVKGRRNWAYALARRAEAGAPHMRYSKITAVDAVAAGVLAQAEIDDARATLPEHVFRELYLAEPSDDGGNPFGLSHIAACAMPAGWLSPHLPVAWGVDLAKSTDWTVCIGLDDAGDVCRYERWQGPWELTIARIKALVGDAPALVDATGVGDPVLEALQMRVDQVDTRDVSNGLGRAPQVVIIPAAAGGNFEGLKFTQQSKQDLMKGLAVAIQQRQIRYADGVIRQELDAFEYQYTATGVRYSAPEGLHDDTVVALGLARQKWIHRPARPSILW